MTYPMLASLKSEILRKYILYRDMKNRPYHYRREKEIPNVYMNLSHQNLMLTEFINYARENKSFFENSVSYYIDLINSSRKEKEENSENDKEKLKHQRLEELKRIEDEKQKELEKKEKLKKEREEKRRLENAIKDLESEFDKDYNKILEDIKEFNQEFENSILNKILSSKIHHSKKLYEKYYYKFNEEDSLFKEDDIELVEIFKIYYKNLNYFPKIINIKNALENNGESIIKFYNNILENQDYLSKSERDRLIKIYYKYFKPVLEIQEFPDLIQKQICNNEKFLKANKFFHDLLGYENLEKTDENNLVKIYNEKYIEKEIQENQSFFENIDNKEIDDINKKRAIVTDEDNMRVIAGAGTGKTFTIQSKVKYLIEKKGISPNRILCLCYTNKGATQLNERVNKVLDPENKVEVSTFHEFCRKVDRSCGGKKTTNRYLLKRIIRNYMKDAFGDDKKIENLIEYFSYYKIPPTDKENFDTMEELEEYEKGKDLKTLKNKYNNRYGQDKFTLQGEIVKSIEELLIANYLFMHEIEYEYEKAFMDNYYYKIIKERFLFSGKFLSLKHIPNKYEFSNEKIVRRFLNWEKARTRYQPDFYLNDYDIYLEHFGVDRDKKNHWLRGNEKIKYETEMNSKIIWHEMYSTNLIVTYSYFVYEGILFDELEKSLKENNVKIGQRNREEMLEILMKYNKINDFENFTKLIENFINIFEAKHFNIDKFKAFRTKSKKTKDAYRRRREELFLDIVQDIYTIYDEYNKGNDIDHNHEITNALDLIESGEYENHYEYILIDEYQDINFVRYKLLKALQESTGKKSKIFVVGDDWQSIFKFSGADVELFINFDNYFPNSETIKIEKTRRNTEGINDVARSFILKNKNQIDKKLEYYKDDDFSKNNSVYIVKYNDISNYYREVRRNKILMLDAIMESISKNYDEGEKVEILLLGRHNKDINDFINNRLFLQKREGKYRKIVYTENKNLDITYMNVHQSKGLEYDEVVVINLEDNIVGFPNQIEDDELLNFVKEKERYQFAEERRLFYVALTRTKNDVYLLTPEFNPSVFIKEIKKDPKVHEKFLITNFQHRHNLFTDSEDYKKIESYPTELKCEECGKGIIVIKHNKERDTKFIRCNNKLCDFDYGPYFGRLEDIKYVEKCPSCRGLLIRQGDILKCCLNYHEGCSETKELILDKEDLEEEYYLE